MGCTPMSEKKATVDMMMHCGATPVFVDIDPESYLMDTTHLESLISERTKAGLAAAKARGRLGGRPQVLNDKQQEVAVKLYQEGEHTIREICQIIGISKTTLYNYLKKANQSLKTLSV